MYYEAPGELYTACICIIMCCIQWMDAAWLVYIIKAQLHELHKVSVFIRIYTCMCVNCYMMTYNIIIMYIRNTLCTMLILYIS